MERDINEDQKEYLREIFKYNDVEEVEVKINEQQKEHEERFEKFIDQYHTRHEEIFYE
ncbi:hypothetical protein BCR32DRAFT_326043 [Anaeromyces robustus]|uniref:Uncharacterized protein n=1 Tax=Anaeromyces robustus TaxID=1754192 RepID=A0A1Y1XEW2_9FUNG|nr:hypothetical protein BCR32DRAFT_326043 [Anaeromyces robustus]|eukprot:ORX84257.1 hypothetical protein BCR32DRAFT_326043 [Anaeromyces robustus]